MSREIRIQFQGNENNLDEKLSIAGKLLQNHDRFEGLDEILVEGDLIKTFSYTAVGTYIDVYQYVEETKSAHKIYFSFGRVRHIEDQPTRAVYSA